MSFLALFLGDPQISIVFSGGHPILGLETASFVLTAKSSPVALQIQ
jgi:hypothetical protein